RGEWAEYRNEPRFRGFERLSLRLLGNVLTVIEDATGDGVLLVKRGAEKVFDENHYRKLFPSRSLVSKRFERIYFAFRMYRLLSVWGYKDNRTYNKERHAFWNALWLLHLGLTDVPRLYTRASIDSIRKGFHAMEGRGARGRRARKLVRHLTRAIWQTWRKARRADPERLTANNFFKSGLGNRQILRHAYPQVHKELRNLGETIATAL